MRKSTKMLKRFAALFLVVLMSIENFAAVVGDNDGSAFITKAEFDNMKSDFQSQLDRYNASLDNKVDGAIAAYLSGIKMKRTSKINNLMGNNIIYFLNNISLISTVIPNSILLNYNLSVLHVDETNKYGSSHYGSSSLGTNTGKYNVYESVDGYNFFRGNAQNIKCYYQIKKVSQLNIPLYGGVPLCTVDANGKLKIKFKLRSSVPSSDGIRFYISDSTLSIWADIIEINFESDE